MFLANVRRSGFINAGGATTFRCGIEGHRLQVTHADGQPVLPVLVDTIVLGVGERYDVIVTADNPGSWPLIAGPVDSVVPGVVAPVVYAGSPELVTPPAVWPPRLLTGRVLRYADLQPLDADATATRTGLARVIALELAGGMMDSAAWTINGQAYPNASPFAVDRGERIRFSIFNRSMVRLGPAVSRKRLPHLCGAVRRHSTAVRRHTSRCSGAPAGV